MEQQGGESRRIIIHPPEDFAGMRKAGRLAAETLDMIAEHVRPGVTTGEIDRLCHDFMVAHGGSVCVSSEAGKTQFCLQFVRPTDIR